MMLDQKIHSKGFTIVELLIVIVVIGILAAITIVAYNSVQGKATYTRERSDMKQIADALAVYHADKDNYPSTIGQAGCTFNWCGWSQVTGDSFITGLSPKYVEKIPQLPTNSNSKDTYLFQSNGTDYQLIRYKDTGLPTYEMTNNELLATGNGYDGLAWGYKTNSGGWW
jgi:general secretion pathway protein G